MASWSDNFNRSNNASLGANWTDDSTNHVNITSNQAFDTSGTNVAIWSANTPANDQFAQATVVANGSGVSSGVCVRWATSQNGYFARFGSTTLAIFKSVAGTPTSLVSVSYTMAANDILRLEVIGTTITAYVNGVSKTSVTDSTFASGKTGLRGGTGTTWDDFSGGDIAVPDAPTIGTATRGNTQATVPFTAPGNNGGSAITGYTVISTPGSLTATGSASPLTVTGLTNGTAYTFTAHATSNAGNSAESSASNSVTPATTPGAPTIGTASAGDAQASVPFTAPGSNGGDTITGYTATSTPGSITGTGASSPLTVTGLTNATAYTFTVHATNGVGNSSESSASNSVTPQASGNTVPGAPTSPSAVRGNAQATVTFTAPASNGGATITGYTATSTPGSFTGTVSGASAAPITVTGLTNGTSYTFTVHATNSVGDSSESSATSAVTPATVPGAPTSPSAARGNTQATVSFTAPASNGGSAVTGYTATSTPGSFTATGSASPLVVTGLTNGTSYTFTIHATNAVGDSSESSATAAVTPATVPGAPTALSATPGNTQATIAFTAPASNGGSAVTSYTLTSSPGGLTGTGASSPITVTGLTNGTLYTFTAKATNAVGDSSASSASNSVRPSTEASLNVYVRKASAWSAANKYERSSGAAWVASLFTKQP